MHALILPAAHPWSLIILLIFGLATSCSISLAMSLTLVVMYKHYNGYPLTLCGFSIVLSLSLSRKYCWSHNSNASFCILLIILAPPSLPPSFLFLTSLLIYLFFLPSILNQAYRLSLLFLFLILQLFLWSWAALTTEENSGLRLTTEERLPYTIMHHAICAIRGSLGPSAMWLLTEYAKRTRHMRNRILKSRQLASKQGNWSCQFQ